MNTRNTNIILKYITILANDANSSTSGKITPTNDAIQATRIEVARIFYFLHSFTTFNTYLHHV